MKYHGKITDPKDLVTKEYVDTGLSGKLGTSGDGSNVTAAFTAASSRTNISTGEKLAVIFGKIAKWFADLGAAAFRGVDSTVTASSTNLVESGAVKSALDVKIDQTDLTTINQAGSTCTEANGIAKGVYFYLDNELVVAKTAIANGATFTSGTNYEAPTAGALNALKSAFIQYEVSVNISVAASGLAYIDVSTGLLPNGYEPISFSYIPDSDGSSAFIIGAPLQDTATKWVARARNVWSGGTSALKGKIKVLCIKAT